MRFTGKKAIAAVGAATALTLGSGLAAYAYWTQGGSGTGSATTGSTSAVSVNLGTSVSGMYPGMSPITLSGNFDNTNSGPVKVGSVTAALGTLPAGCSAADFTIGGTAAVNAEVAHGTGVGSWTGLTLTMNNTSSNQDLCKGQTIPLTFSVSAGS